MHIEQRYRTFGLEAFDSAMCDIRMAGLITDAVIRQLIMLPRTDEMPENTHWRRKCQRIMPRDEC